MRVNYNTEIGPGSYPSTMALHRGMAIKLNTFGITPRTGTGTGRHNPMNIPRILYPMLFNFILTPRLNPTLSLKRLSHRFYSISSYLRAHGDDRTPSLFLCRIA